MPAVEVLLTNPPVSYPGANDVLRYGIAATKPLVTGAEAARTWPRRDARPQPPAPA